MDFTSLRAENLLLSVRAGAKTLATIPQDFPLDAHARRAFSFQVVLIFTSLRAENLLLSVQAGAKTLATVPQDFLLDAHARRAFFQIVLIFTSLRAENLLLSVQAGAKTLATVPQDFLLDAHARRAFSSQIVLDFHIPSRGKSFAIAHMVEKEAIKKPPCTGGFLGAIQSGTFLLFHKRLCEAQAENELDKSECGNDDVRECSD